MIRVWSDAACGYQSTEGKCRSGYVIGLMSPTLSAPRHISRRASNFTRKLVKGRSGGGVHALSGTVGHMMLFKKKSYGPFAALGPGVAGLGGCGNLFTQLNTRRMVAEKYSARRFLSIQHALVESESDHVYWANGEARKCGATMFPY